jgi:hypothetical protein
MAAPHLIQKIFSVFKGLDKRSSDFVRTQEFASDLENGRIRSDGALIKRPGYSLIGGDDAGGGLYTWNDIDENGQIIEKIVTLSNDLKLYYETSINLKYTGTEPAFVWYSIIVNNSTKNLNIIIDYKDVSTPTKEVNIDLGTGFGDDIDLSSLKASTDLSSNNITLTLDSSLDDVKAAYLELDKNKLVDTTAGVDIKVFVAQTPRSEGGSLFSSHYSNIGQDYFENATFANVNGNLYISTGYTELMKFDGQRVYRAGLPKPSDMTATAGSTQSASGVFGATSFNPGDVGLKLYVDGSSDARIDFTPSAFNQAIDKYDGNLGVHYTYSGGSQYNHTTTDVSGDYLAVTGTTWGSNGVGEAFLTYSTTEWFPLDPLTGGNPLSVGDRISLYLYGSTNNKDSSLTEISITEINTTKSKYVDWIKTNVTASTSNTFKSDESITCHGRARWKYFYTLVNKDANGNIVESVPSEYTSSLEYIPDELDFKLHDITLTIPSFATANFNSSANEIDSVTDKVITMVNTPNCIVGDLLYVFNDTDSKWIESKVTDVTGDDVTISDTITASSTTYKKWCSSGATVRIYRTTDIWIANSAMENPLPDYFLLDEISIHNESSPITYSDTTSDADIIANGAYTQPVKDHGLPPKGKYITAWNNQLVIAGNLDNMNTLYYSDYTSPEYFPSWTNSIEINTKFGDKVTGVAPLSTVLYVFQGNSIHTIMGDLITDVFRVSTLSTAGEVGCVAHHSINEVKDSLFFLSDKGVYSLQNGRGAPQELSSIISPLFSSSLYNKPRSQSINWAEKDLFLLYMPKANDASSDIIVAYDHFRNAWFKWTNLDCKGGMTLLNRNVIFNNNNSTSTKLCSLNGNNNSSDYIDNHLAIPFKYVTHWESLGDPSINKKFLRIKLHTLDPEDTFESPNFALDVNMERNYVPATIANIQLSYAGSSGWGTSEWGIFLWGEHTKNAIKHKLPTGWSKSFRFSFENNEPSENILISGYELEIASPVRQELKD